jgi:hypothetical protein
MSTVGPSLVYLLCLVTSVVCAVLLIRAWQRSRSKLLLWSAISFALLAVNNALLVADVMLIRDVSLLWARQLTAFGAVCVLIYGFIWEVDR